MNYDNVLLDSFIFHNKEIFIIQFVFYLFMLFNDPDFILV